METKLYSNTIEWRIIANKLNKKPITYNEEQQLKRWLDASPDHAEYFNRAAKAWKEKPLNAPKIDITHFISEFDSVTEYYVTRSHKRHLRFTAYSIAALVAGVLITLAAYLTVNSSQDVCSVSDTMFSHQSIHPGSSRACLILPDGDTLELNAATNRRLSPDTNSGFLSIADGTVTCSYLINNTNPINTVNTIVIPRGGEYNITLSDGSRVWLNANTRMHFPTSFSSDSRIVELDGEAYFEIAKDPQRQFIVKTSISDIKVYGTEFNVRSYTRDHSQQVTLLSGSIAVEYDDSTYMLSPGQQARITRGSDQMRTLDVDPDTYCSWVNGLFVFENRPLHEILSQLSDWYDTDFIYTDTSLRHLHFTGDLERYSDFSEILSLIEMTTSVQFTIMGQTVKVSPRK